MDYPYLALCCSLYCGGRINVCFKQANIDYKDKLLQWAEQVSPLQATVLSSFKSPVFISIPSSLCVYSCTEARSHVKGTGKRGECFSVGEKALWAEPVDWSLILIQSRSKMRCTTENENRRLAARSNLVKGIISKSFPFPLRSNCTDWVFDILNNKCKKLLLFMRQNSLKIRVSHTDD